MTEYRNPHEAFEDAIRDCRLSANPSAANYAGFYMYMGPSADGSKDAFKHEVTRKYIA